MTVMRSIGLGFAAVVGIAALLMLLVGLIASLFGDEAGAGCLAIGVVLAAVAVFIASKVAQA
jgi:hypothetical protein